jgi:GH24 family phage-related lysozyme (muramidase)
LEDRGVDKQAIALVVELVKLTEKFEEHAYKDPVNADGLPITIGYGSTKARDGEKWQIGDWVSYTEALWLLQRDVSEAYWPCSTIPHWQDMDAYQRAALADLNFNEGYTYGDGDHDSLDLALKLCQYRRIGKILQLYDNNDSLGLSRRRYAEWLLWQGAGPKDAYSIAWGIDSVARILEAIS